MDTETAIGNLKRINDNYISSDILRKVNSKIWEYPEFTRWPGSIGKHHSYEGGLVVHTEEVWKYALNTSSEFEVDLDILFTSILWHDLAKIWDYKVAVKSNWIADGLFPERHVLTEGVQEITRGGFTYEADEAWIKSDYHANIHHITGSIAEFTRHALNEGVDRSIVEKVQHCMAGHHGFPEFRSPVTPKSVEAIILHYSDMLSATHGKTR